MFSESVKYCIKNYFRVKGRTSRKVFWYFMLLLIIISGCSTIFQIDYIIYQGSISSWLSILFSVGSLFFVIPSITAMCRRLHDIGKPAPWVIIFFVPIIGWILFLVWTLRKSDGDNRFGKKSSIDE